MTSYFSMYDMDDVLPYRNSNHNDKLVEGHNEESLCTHFYHFEMLHSL